MDVPVLAHGGSTHARVLRPRGVRQQLAITRPAILPSAKGNCVGTPNQGDISPLNSPACMYPSTLRLRPHGRRRMTRGHRGSLHLRCRAFSSPPPCRFIPAHAPSLHPHRAQQEIHRYYEPIRRRAPDRYSVPHGLNPLGTLPLAPQLAGSTGTRLPRSVREQQTGLTSPTCRTPPGQSAGTRQGSSRSPTCWPRF